MKTLLFTITAVILAYLAILNYQVEPTYSTRVTPTITVAPTSAPMLELINEERQEVGLPELTYYEPLTKSAKIKACDMAENDYFAHEDLDGRMSWHIINYYLSQDGEVYLHAGENLAKGLTVTEQAMDAWMASPTHRDNILGEQYSLVGYATCGIYTVQHFAELQ